MVSGTKCLFNSLFTKIYNRFKKTKFLINYTEQETVLLQCYIVKDLRSCVALFYGLRQNSQKFRLF
ncbi:hypothetical protein DGG96_14620 [Legionella qingyii]|uniref:Uncharacterized protein n=1 Tax=Legionella qingyii TaxID=2184757 RepID=A0A317U127_9GAMM|nr:hypothetical protein DGG96_14620 [Legionella qingyii]